MPKILKLGCGFVGELRIPKGVALESISLDSDSLSCLKEDIKEALIDFLEISEHISTQIHFKFDEVDISDIIEGE